MATRLLVSLSGANERSLDVLSDVARLLDGRGVPLTLLVRPRACASSRPLTGWVKARARRGDTVLMHGYDHVVTPAHRPVWPGGRAEFARLPAHEAGLRLSAAAAALDRVELPVDGFAPPRWLASRGTLTALRRHGFPLCADAVGVHDLRSGAVHRARVLTLGGNPANRTSDRTETVRCFAFVLASARAARRGGPVRLGVDLAELGRPGPRQALLDAVDVAVESGAVACTYRGLVTAQVSPRRTGHPGRV